MVQTLQHARIEFVVLSFGITSLAIFLRGLRWGVLVSARKRVNSLTMFWATAIGYLGNTFLPARSGEVLRAVVLGKTAGISGGYVFATALTERVMDAIALVIISSLVIQSMPIAMPGWLPTAIQTMAVAGVLILFLFLLAPRFEGFIKKLLSLIHLPEKINAIISNLISQFLLGTQSLVHPGRAVIFLICTIVIWLVDGIGAIIFAHALNLSLTLNQALLLLSALGLSSAVPSTPGYVGVYQFVAVTVMPVFGISNSQALSYILGLQATTIVAILVWGLIGMWRVGLNLRSVWTDLKHKENVDPDFPLNPS